MRKSLIFMALLVAIAVPAAYAQAATPGDIPIKFDESQAIIIGIGFFGGLTIAYLNWRKTKPEVKFDGRKFLRPLIVAVLISIPLAITASTGLVELNLVTMFMVFMASIGTAELSKKLR